MKKTLVSALTTALVVGAASTTFAAANPFSDVPADHWAYDAVSQLAADGVIEGYGDSTFKGNRNITRYEMAQMVAKAMAKNTSGVDKALVDKLAAEFAEELNNLGVRVANLERNADMVKWNGKAEYTYTNNRYKNNAGTKASDSDGNLLFRLEPTAEVNSNWHVKARLDANTKVQSDDDNQRVRLRRLWAQGDYGKFQVKLGKFASFNDDAWADTTFSGAEVSYGKDLKGVIGFGRTNRNSDFLAAAAGGVAGNKSASAGYQYVGVEYNKDKVNAGLAYHRAKLSNGAVYNGFKNGINNEDTLNLIGVKAGYTFSKNVALKAWYSQTNADVQKKAGSVEVDYKGAQKENKGTWGAWLAYRGMGRNGALNPDTFDVVKGGEKGWEIGGNYTVFKNVVATLRYGNVKAAGNGQFNDNGFFYKKAQRFFGRVEFFF